MSFKEVASLDADVTVALGKKDKKTGKPYPKQAEGYYLGSRTVNGGRGDSILHFLQTANGNLGVWGTTDLNRKLGQAKLGTMVRITSTGTKATPKGDMYMYKVETDNENTIEVEAAASGPSSSGYVESEDDSGYNADSEEFTGADEDAGQVAALAAAERQARVQALLNKNKGNGAVKNK